MADPWDYLPLDDAAEQAARRSRAKYAKRVPLGREELRGDGPAIPEGLLKRVVSSATGISERKVGDIGQFAKDIGHGVATLPQRALQASEAQRLGYGFDPQTVTEAAGMAVGLPGIAAIKKATGFGKVRPPVADPALAAETIAKQAQGLRTPIAGLPDKMLELEPGVHFKPGPIENVHQLAEQYMAGKGMRYEPKRTYMNVDPERAGRIAQAFDEMPHAPNDPKVRASYDAMIKETVDQFRQLENAGVKFEFIKPGQADPYAASPRMAQKDFIENKHLWVYPTDAGFGSAGEAATAAMRDNPLLRSTGVKIDGRDLPANDLFRIVHDVFGHFKEGTGFRAGGEENAWRSHAAMYSPDALPAMTTETRGQNSWLNYGPHGATNRTAKSADTVFADQKIGLLPEWVMKEGFDETGYALGSGARDQSGRAAVTAATQGKRPAVTEPPLPKPAPFPQYATEYPPVGPPVMKTDKVTGKVYEGKQWTPEATAFMKERERINKQMKGGYEPFYDPAKRSRVDVSHYPPNLDTSTVTPAKQATIDKYMAEIGSEETRQRLRDAVKRGEDLGDSSNWYAMAQLEADFIKELGPEAGREAFKQKFATSMAATTGGSSPESNLLTAQYGNYLRTNELPYPTASHELPVPIGGGKHGMSNIEKHKQVFDEGGFSSLGGQNAKRHDFAWDFMGGNAPVIDEQMALGMVPSGISVIKSNKGASPRPGNYGLFSQVVREEAAKAGKAADSMQGEGWYGFKGEPGKPMIGTVNDIIERTHRLTGMPREEIVRRGFVRGEIPLYGLAGAAGLGAVSPWDGLTYEDR